MVFLPFCLSRPDPSSPNTNPSSKYDFFSSSFDSFFSVVVIVESFMMVSTIGSISIGASGNLTFEEDVVDGEEARVEAFNDVLLSLPFALEKVSFGRLIFKLVALDLVVRELKFCVDTDVRDGGVNASAPLLPFNDVMRMAIAVV